ncbi:MAG: peroxiredoxin-like family protein [Rhodospirillales bacterium]
MSLKQELQELASAVRARRTAEAQAGIDRLMDGLRAARLAQDCLQVGETAPDFELPDAEGRLVALDRLLRRGPAVIAFYRGGWCAFCNLALRALQRALPAIESRGASLVAISPQINPGPSVTRDKLGLSFPLLTDGGNKVARLFGLTFRLPPDLVELYRRAEIDIAQINGMQDCELPLPATYVVGRHGDVTHAFIEPDFTERAEPADIVAALEQLGGAAPEAAPGLKTRAI